MQGFAAECYFVNSLAANTENVLFYSTFRLSLRQQKLFHDFFRSIWLCSNVE